MTIDYDYCYSGYCYHYHDYCYFTVTLVTLVSVSFVTTVIRFIVIVINDMCYLGSGSSWVMNECNGATPDHPCTEVWETTGESVHQLPLLLICLGTYTLSLLHN